MRVLSCLLFTIVWSLACAALPASQARMRTQVRSEFRPQQAYQALVQFHSAVLQQYLAGGMEHEQLAVIVRWVAVGDGILTGPQPDTWEATAREVWPVVRSLIGPYDSLQPFARTFDALLQ